MSDATAETSAREPVVPSGEDARELILGPDSIIWQRFSDARVFLGAGAALLLQVAHPTVGSGVRDHSNFMEDPWGRLFRTTDYLNLMVYAGDEAIEVGRRIREMHKQIKGTNPDGSRYHALEPDAYAWVHATLIHIGIAAHLRFVGPLSETEIERMYAEYRPLGRLLGVRSRDLPERWSEFCDYVDTTIDESLERTSSVEDVLGAIERPGAPPVFPDTIAPLWKLLRMPPSRALRISSFGLLGSRARARLGIEWTEAGQTELRALGAVARAATAIMPQTLRQTGPAYLKWRRAEIARGPLGPGPDGVGAAANG